MNLPGTLLLRVGDELVLVLVLDVRLIGLIRPIRPMTSTNPGGRLP